MRALVVTNMYPTPERPALGPFVRDQVEALRRRGDVEVELFAFPPGPRDYPRAARELRRRYRGRARSTSCTRTSGSTAWPALLAARLGPVVVTLHGNDLFHPRSNRLTRAIAARSPRSPPPSRASSARTSPARGRRGASRCSPSASTSTRFRPIPRARGARAARARPGRPVPAVPARPVAAAEALRPRARGGRRRAAAHARRTCRRTRSRTGSTPPTRCSCRRRTRASGCR